MEEKNISKEINEEDRAYIACALDTDLITEQDLSDIQQLKSNS